MIHTEIYNINGRSFTLTWADSGFIERDGIVYEEANDPTELNRVYKEVDGPDIDTSDEIDIDGDDTAPSSSIIERRIRLAARYASV